MDKMIQLTVWGSALDALQSQYGLCTFVEWLNREQERLESRGIKCEIQPRKGHNTFALFRTPWPLLKEEK